MADTDFYNLNRFRNYPLIDESNTSVTAVPALVQKGCADVGIVLFPSSGFDNADDGHKFFISSVGPNRNLTLYPYAVGTPIHAQEITISLGAGASYGREIFNVTDVAGVIHGYGWVIVGEDLGTDTYSYASAISSAPATVPYVERRCIQVMDGHYINKLVVANQPRTVVPETYDSSSSAAPYNSSSNPTEGYLYAPGGEHVTGDIRFREGYNIRITVSELGNALQFSARKGAGLGEACEEVPRTYHELVLAERGLPLDNSPRCHEVITNFNGVGPDSAGVFKLFGGKGVDISSPNAHTITIIGRESMEDCV